MHLQRKKTWPSGHEQHATSESIEFPHISGDCLFCAPAGKQINSISLIGNRHDIHASWAEGLPRRYRLAMLAGVRNAQNPKVHTLKPSVGFREDSQLLILPSPGKGASSVPSKKSKRPVTARGWLAAVVLLGGLVMVGVLTGAWTLGGIQDELAATRERLVETRTRLEASESRLRSTDGRMKAAADRMADQLAFALDMARRNTERLSSAERQMAEIGKVEKQPVTVATVKRWDDLIFARIRKAVLFIRTEYTVRFLLTGEERNLTAYGTGFFITPDGVALTAQHVLYPWRYEKPLQASMAAGMVEVLEDRTRITAWPTGSRVVVEKSEDEEATREDADFLFQNGYSNDTAIPTLSILGAGRFVTAGEWVGTPVGPIEVDSPQLGRGDWALFQVSHPGRRFDHLILAEEADAVAALDEVLVVGYPLSRLKEGVAEPQPSRGRVRRAGKVLEVDAPLHPGNSGGPIVDRHGRVVGLASAILDSAVYGIAVPGRELYQGWQETKARIRATIRTEQARLKSLGCDPGPIDGLVGTQTLAARHCAALLTAPLPLEAFLAPI